ncbi:hypothetical protein [uncultured Campylobacter sp.]|uniref:hypothetical protein n=1 Tax=uncultured Campylobacter sp. TaxID=218934 RepID=UPI0026268384|nr:hypothetical protein [uncultured Campylobacter sp.]
MKFYKSVKFKIIAAALLLAAILCAAFIRIVPDYSTSRGFAIVTTSDYNKYKQGYCLKEDRILPKEELYKRAIGQYLDKFMDMYRAQVEWRKKDFFYKPRYDTSYYEMENLNFNNYIKIIGDYRDKNFTSEEIYMNILSAKATDPKKYLKINLNNMSAGFSKPLIRVLGYDYTLMLDSDYILHEDYFDHNFFIWEALNKDNLKIYYEHNRPMEKIYFDNCGDVKYDVEKEYLEGRELTGG